MATFEAKVYRLTIEEHPNADAIELAIVGDYRSIVRKGQFKTGDLGVYIPEAAVCPEWLIMKLGLEGRLAGKQHNRVKAVKLRGVLSQGLIYPVSSIVVGNEKCVCVARPTDTEVVFARTESELIGVNVADFLGLTKWEPPIPVHMAGEIANAFGYTLPYDIENFKKYPSILQDPSVLQKGEEVVMTEKIHGTWCCFGYHPEYTASHIITSKGLSDKGVVFKVNERNRNNLYLRALDRTASKPDGIGGTVIDRAIDFGLGNGGPFYILGEIFGNGVQDLRYGATVPQFRVFDIYVGSPGEGEYVSYDKMIAWCIMLEVEPVPRLYRGPFSHDKMMELTSGMESVSGEKVNIREGVVIRPVVERRDTELGRVILKSVSEDYLLRKGKLTEYN